MTVTCSRCKVVGHRKNSKKCPLAADIEHTSLIKARKEAEHYKKQFKRILKACSNLNTPLNDKLKKYRREIEKIQNGQQLNSSTMNTSSRATRSSSRSSSSSNNSSNSSIKSVKKVIDS